MLLAFNYRGLLRNPLFWLLCAMLIVMLVADPAHAAQQGGGSNLPWEAPLEKLQKSISGPVAFVIALLGIVACGATLIWGGEISEFTRRIIYLVLVVCLIVSANSLLTGTLFQGAAIPARGLLLDPGAAHAVIGAPR